MISTRRLRALFSGSDSGRSAAPTSRRHSTSAWRGCRCAPLHQRSTTLTARSRDSSKLSLITERLDRLIVGVPDHQHAARHLVQRRASAVAIVASYAGLTDGAAGRETDRARAASPRVRLPVLLDAQHAAALVGRQQLLERRTPNRHRPVAGREILQSRPWRARPAPDRRGPRGSHSTRERDREYRPARPRRPATRAVPNERIAAVLQSSPAQRQARRRLPAMIADLAIEIVLDLLQVLVAPLLHLVLAGEAEGDPESTAAP